MAPVADGFLCMHNNLAPTEIGLRWTEIAPVGHKQL